MIGDAFLKETLDAFYALRRTVLAAKKPVNIPYLLKQFNVSGHYMTSGIANIINRFINALVELLNKRPKLAKYILIIPDRDIVDKVANMDGQSIMLGSITHCIIKQFNTYIQRHRIDLTDKKPGAVIDAEHPKIIWVSV